MKKFLVLSLVMLLGFLGFAQGFSLNDTTIVIKDKQGNTLTKEQVMSLMQQKFSMSTQNLPNGKRVITIAPISESELDQSKKEKEIFINSLLGKKLAGFSFQDINGKRLDSSSTKGKMVVMNFWFTSCKPCIAEMPELNKLVIDYKGKDVVFIAVSFDNKEAIQKFITKRPFNYNLVADQQSYIDKLNATSYPVHIITDANGIVRKVVVGFNDDTIEQLRNTLEKMINK